MPYPKGATKKQKAKFRRCVIKVEKKGTARSPHAVCMEAVFGKKKKRKR